LQILQTAVAACAAWFLSVLLLGVDRPTFAPIAAVICLGLAVGERGRRAVELTLGVAFGVAIADFLVFVVGVGALQAGLVVALAMALAVFLGREEVGVKEAAISAMIIMITFHSPDSGLPLVRFLEALIGGSTALLINALLPVNPERMVEEAAHPLFEESVAVLEEVAGALDGGDAERAQNAYVKAREGGRYATSGPRRPGEKPRRQHARRSDPLLRCRPSREHRPGPGSGTRSPGGSHRTSHMRALAVLEKVSHSEGKGIRLQQKDL
jgi:uncharacterized membrane protein YgaE (UPF0421/DUF939 family)